MSHHFDSKIAREDPSLNLCDFYLFEGAPGKTVMILTVNPDAGLSASDIFHSEGLYAFRFDLDGDAREELAFKARFEPPRHKDGAGPASTRIDFSRGVYDEGLLERSRCRSLRANQAV
jgi:hypothetical protein